MSANDPRRHRAVDRGRKRHAPRRCCGTFCTCSARTRRSRRSVPGACLLQVASGSAPKLFEPVVPFTQFQTISRMMPMPVKAMSSHHPVRSRSCRRRTETATPGSSSAKDITTPIRPVPMAPPMMPPHQVCKSRKQNPIPKLRTRCAARESDVIVETRFDRFAEVHCPASELRRRHLSGTNRYFDRAESDIKTIAAVHSQCRIWVKSGHFAMRAPCPLYPPTAFFVTQEEAGAANTLFAPNSARNFRPWRVTKINEPHGYFKNPRARSCL
jgi:hypothetical protein